MYDYSFTSINCVVNENVKAIFLQRLRNPKFDYLFYWYVLFVNRAMWTAVNYF